MSRIIHVCMIFCHMQGTLSTISTLKVHYLPYRLLGYTIYHIDSQVHSLPHRLSRYNIHHIDSQGTLSTISTLKIHYLPYRLSRYTIYHIDSHVHYLPYRLSIISVSLMFMYYLHPCLSYNDIVCY